jgi:hypothetical protein
MCEDVETSLSLGTSVFNHALDSKSFETIAAIIKRLQEHKSVEINREVGVHRWTPLYRAG